MRIIAISNEKGGVGKTSTTVNLAAAFGLRDQNVLVVDLDSQGHATQWFGVPMAQVQSERSSYAVLTYQTALDQTIVRTAEQGVLLCPAHPFLAKAAKELGDQVDGIFSLRDALEQTSAAFDTVVIDCPPSKGTVVFNALMAADIVLAPVLAEALSVQGLTALDETVQRIQQRYSPQLPRPLIVINNYEGRATIDRQLLDDLNAAYGQRVMSTIIGRDAPLREAFLAQMSIFRHRATARSATQFRALADEVMRCLDG